MLVRQLQDADIGAVCGLMHQLGYSMPIEALQERVNAVMSSSGHCVFVAEDASGVVGVVHALERASLEKGAEVVVQAMVVDAACRGSGVGKALMREVEAWAQSRNVKSVVLHTRTNRNDAHAFYARNGFVPVATATLMRKQLNQIG